MPRLQAIDPAIAQGKAKALLDGVGKAIGITPNIMRTMANAPAVLDAYLAFNRALGAGSLTPETREAIALTVAGLNGCDYCAAAHTAGGRSLGLAAEELTRNLDGGSADPGRAAALALASAIVEKRGWASDTDLESARAAGYDDGGIAEIVAVTAINTFTNYFNHVAETDLDFPAVAVPRRGA